MSADFSKLLAHLQANLEAHAERDGLSPVRRAVFLARGGHAPGDVCPSTKDEPASEQAWCFTCERMHGPMEWGDGCMDEVEQAAGYSASHHRVKRETVSGRWEVARPLRDTSWWHRRKQERACRKRIGHCWHPEGMIDWWCCECSAETEGMPGQDCKLCTAVTP